MRFVSKTTTSKVLILVALLLSYAGSTGAPAFAQYDVPPGDQYGLPPEDQYDSSPPSTTPLTEDRYGAPPEDQNGGGGDTGADNEGTVPLDEGGDGANEDDDGATEATPPERPPPDTGGGPAGRLDGVFVGGLKLLAVFSVITTVFFFFERLEDRPGL